MKDPACQMHRERSGIVIRVSSFVGMCQHYVGADFVHQIRDVENQLEQLHARFAIHVSEIPASVGSYAQSGVMISPGTLINGSGDFRGGAC
jgi:hypothetical protein